jgi:hypothetical protein
MNLAGKGAPRVNYRGWRAAGGHAMAEKRRESKGMEPQMNADRSGEFGCDGGAR